MPQRYHVVSTQDTSSALDSRDLARFLAKDGQLLLPVLDLIENAQAAVDDLIEVMGRATIGAVLMKSATQLAGPKQRGKKTDRDVAYHGSQAGRVALKERQLRVTIKSRLRRKAPRPGEPGEAEIPAYEAMRMDARLADRMRPGSIGENDFSRPYRRAQRLISGGEGRIPRYGSRTSRERSMTGEQVRPTSRRVLQRTSSPAGVVRAGAERFDRGSTLDFAGPRGGSTGVDRG